MLFKRKPPHVYTNKMKEPEFSLKNKYNKPKYNYSENFFKKDLKFILECAMKTKTIDKIDITLVGLYYTHPLTYHRLVQWSIYNRDALTPGEYAKLMIYNVQFYSWLYDMPRSRVKAVALKCRDHRPPTDCGKLCITLPEGVSPKQVKGKLTTKRQLTQQYGKTKKKKHKKNKKH